MCFCNTTKVLFAAALLAAAPLVSVLRAEAPMMGGMADDPVKTAAMKQMSDAKMMAADPNTPAMHDDRPVNEYALLRTVKGSRFQPDSLVAWYEHTKNP